MARMAAAGPRSRAWPAMNAAYLLKQLQDFDGGSRNNAVMGPIAKALSPADRKAMADYYAALPVPAALAHPAPAATAAGDAGALLATRGQWSKGVPACVQCHGPGGIGVGDHFPALAGQPAGYIAAQLEDWQDGTRKNDPLELMRHLAGPLTSKEIWAVSEWFARQPAVAGRHRHDVPGACAGGPLRWWRCCSADATASARRRTAFQDKPDKPASPPPATATSAATNGRFVPPDEADIPDGPFGDVVRRGRDIFTNTGEHAAAYVGNGLSCRNCHLDAGRLANSAPLWGAYVRYPAYRSKNKHVNTYAERLQGCFTYSMNGKAPPADSPELVALEAYSFWMAKGAPVGATAGRAPAIPKVPGRAQPPDYARGEKVFEHEMRAVPRRRRPGPAGRRPPGLPAAVGRDSYNWGAGMHQRRQRRRPSSRPTCRWAAAARSATQDAWDVAMFINATSVRRIRASPATSRRRASSSTTIRIRCTAPRSMAACSAQIPPRGDADARFFHRADPCHRLNRRRSLMSSTRPALYQTRSSGTWNCA